MRATSRDSLVGRDRDGELSEDTLQATIEKSKKVLALQRELLNQITSRSKIVSSIRNSNIVSTDDDSSVRENDISLLGLEVALISDVSNKNGTVPSLEEDNGSIFSSDQGTSTSSETPVSQPVTTSRDFDKDVALLGEKSKFLSLGTPSPARYQPEMKDATSPYSDKNDIVPPSLSSVSEIVSPDSDKNDIVPSSLSSVSEISSSTLDKNDIVLSSLSSISEISISKDEKQEDDSEEATMQLDADNEDSDSTIEDAKPPPLAAANVMNMLLVAAECAPWIKTGGLGDVAGSLLKALARRGHQVMVVVPWYSDYAEPRDTGVRKSYKVNGQTVICFVLELTYMEEIGWIF